MKDGWARGLGGSRWRWRVEQVKGKYSHGDWVKEDSDAESEDEGGEKVGLMRVEKMAVGGWSSQGVQHKKRCGMRAASSLIFVDSNWNWGLMTGLLRRPILQTHTRRSECPSWHSWQALEAGWARSGMDLPFAMA